MEVDPRARLKEWLASGQARLQPLTFPQRELWETSPVPPGDPANNICSLFEIHGPLIVEEVGNAIQKVVDRQDAMRTTFLPGKERPVQLIRTKGEVALSFRELGPSETSPERLAEAVAGGFGAPFDLVRGPLFRAELLRRGPEDHVLAFTIHHAVADGWTLGSFVEDLCTAYVIGLRNSGRALGQIRGIRDSLPPVPMTYSAWGAVERAQWQPDEIQRHLDYWRERLIGSCLLFGKSHGESGAPLVPLTNWVTSIPSELAESARKIARQSGATLFNVLLAAFQLALHRWNGVLDVVVGTPVANRSKAVVRETMGYFAGVVPLRGRIVMDRSFADTVRAVHEETVDDFAHAMPFAELAAALGEPPVPGKHVVFDVRFALQNHPVPDMALPGISTRLRTCATGTSRFDLGCELTEDGGEFELVWLHRPSVVTDLDIRELDRIFRDVLTTVCRDSGVCPAAMTS